MFFFRVLANPCFVGRKKCNQDVLMLQSLVCWELVEGWVFIIISKKTFMSLFFLANLFLNESSLLQSFRKNHFSFFPAISENLFLLNELKKNFVNNSSSKIVEHLNSASFHILTKVFSFKTFVNNLFDELQVSSTYNLCMNHHSKLECVVRMKITHLKRRS